MRRVEHVRAQGLASVRSSLPPLQSADNSANNRHKADATRSSPARRAAESLAFCVPNRNGLWGRAEDDLLEQAIS